MIYLSTFYAVELADWAERSTYHDALMYAYILISVLLAALLDRSRGTSLLYRTLLAASFVDSLVDIAVLTGFLQGWGDTSSAETILFLIAMVYLIGRDYDVPGGAHNPNKVCIMLLRPRSTFEVIKAFVGLPVSSVCIAANGQVWAFRHKTGRFERMPYNRAWGYSHITIDTGIMPTEKIIAALDASVGSSCGIGCKCVWTIRHVLALLGGEWNIRTRFDYIPGVYAARIIRN